MPKQRMMYTILEKGSRDVVPRMVDGDASVLVAPDQPQTQYMHIHIQIHTYTNIDRLHVYFINMVNLSDINHLK